ncbi:hypothetical protein TUM20985_10660 [Mycobacterium antarcticum]|nr:hypothetical protein TUM20985_10660 [Mycolicibacterium sp. TUM20985]GLP79643.1 hypothetical protein TUM20984_10630 [Mycolicibacterium sp. TUM20984]
MAATSSWKDVLAWTSGSVIVIGLRSSLSPFALMVRVYGARRARSFDSPISHAIARIPGVSPLAHSFVDDEAA